MLVEVARGLGCAEGNTYATAIRQHGPGELPETDAQMDVGFCKKARVLERPAKDHARVRFLNPVRRVRLPTEAGSLWKFSR